MGTILKGLPEGSKLPWHRVINASGKISLPKEGSGRIQQERLEREGVTLLKGKVSLRHHGWQP